MKNNRILKSFFILNLLLFPLGEILRFNVLKDVLIKPLDISIGITFMTYIALCIRNKYIPRNTIGRQVIIFGIIGVLSLIFTTLSLSKIQLLSSVLYLLRWFIYLSTYLVVSIFDTKFKKIIMKGMFIDGIIILTAGFIQYFLYPNLRNLYYLGWDEHNFRLFSTFLDPNFAGAFFVLFFIFIMYFFHKTEKNKQSKLVFFAFTSAICLIAVFLSYSRSAVLMLLSAGTIYLILINKKKYLILLPIGLLLITVIFLPTFNKENTNPFRKNSSLARVDSYRNAINIAMKHPILGVGFNTYRYALQEARLKEKETQFPNHSDAGVDNSFLFVLATTGIIGLFGYLYIFITLIISRYKLYIKENNIFALIFLVSAAGLAIDSFFINSLFYASFMFWMWICAGISEV